jgi:site-specific DNA recombinase
VIPGGHRAVRAASLSRMKHDELWDAAKARHAEVRITMTRDVDGNTLNGAHRRKYLLSGLLECGVCGGGYTIIDAAKYGCATHRSKGTCSNDLKVKREELERRVLNGLRERLLAPELVEEFARAFQEEVNRLAAEKTRHRAEDEGRLEAVRRKARAWSARVARAAAASSWTRTAEKSAPKRGSKKARSEHGNLGCRLSAS